MAMRSPSSLRGSLYFTVGAVAMAAASPTLPPRSGAVLTVPDECKNVTVSTQADIDAALSTCDIAQDLLITDGQGNLTFPGMTYLYGLALSGDNRGDLVSVSFPDLSTAENATFASATALLNISMPEATGPSLVIDDCPSLAAVGLENAAYVDLTLRNMGEDGTWGLDDVFRIPSVTEGSFALHNVAGESYCVEVPALTYLDGLVTDNSSCLLAFGNVTAADKLEMRGDSAFQGQQAWGELTQVTDLQIGPGMGFLDAGNLTTVSGRFVITDTDYTPWFDLVAITDVGDFEIYDMSPLIVLPGDWNKLETARGIRLQGNISTVNDYNMFPALHQVNNNITFQPTNDDFDCAAATAKFEELPNINEVICYWSNGTLYATQAQASNSDNPQTTGSSSSSSAGVSDGVWIAVGVLAGVIALVVVGLAVFFTRRHQKKQLQRNSGIDSGNNKESGTEGIAEKDGIGSPTAGRNELLGNEKVEIDSRVVTMQLDSTDRYEMAASSSSSSKDNSPPRYEDEYRAELPEDCMPVEAMGRAEGQREEGDNKGKEMEMGKR